MFDKLVQVRVFGCACHRIADDTVSATTLRRRRDKKLGAGVMEAMLQLVLADYDRMIGLELAPTLDVLVLSDSAMTVQPNRGYDSDRTRAQPAGYGFAATIAEGGKPAQVTAPWTNAHKQLVWCTERQAVVVSFWIASTAVLIVVNRLVR